MNISENVLSTGSSLASQVHAAAVNGDKGALQRLIVGNSALKDKEDQFGRTPLMYCVLADRLDCADALLKAGADVNKTDHSRRTALHLAAQKGNYRFMKLLLTRRANWMQKDLEEMTPLHLSTRHRSPKCLALLLKFMAPGEVDTQDKNKQTALHWSAYYNNPEHAKLLIKHDSNIGIPDVEGKIPLHWAANHKDASAVHTVRCILDAAPTESLLNWQDYEGRTPLHFAVADGNLTVVDVLTSYESCNITSYDNLFRTPLHWAALLGHAQIVHLLLERNKSGTVPSDSQGATPLHYAAQSNFAETVKVFLTHPSVRDDSDLEGRTSFMWAAGKGSDDVLRTMLSLKSDIDINMADKYGGTALHAAALSGHVSTVKLLLDNDAQVDATDVMKHTPLFRACEMGHRDVIQTLIKGGARVDLVDQDGHSLLHWAALGGNADVCQILIENKINPNVQDYAGRTPLQCAAYGGYINCMAVLMENNADPNIQDKEGRTALHWSCNNGYLDAIKLLLDFAAFPNQMENNEERYTPLDYALLGERHEVIQFMLEHGALSIAAIQDIAAFKIQAVYKGYKVRKAFRDRKNLLMKHEQLRKDAAAKKREEENKRKEAEQKGQPDTDPPRPQVLPCPPSPQNEPSRQSAAPSKQPPASHTVQSPDPEQGRPAGQCPGRASHRDCSSDLQGTASRKPSESPREHCRGASAGVHPRSCEDGDSYRHQGTSSAEKCRGETSGEHQRCEQGPSRARQPVSTGSAGPAEKGEDSSPAITSASQRDRPRKPSKRQDGAPRSRGASQKRRTHQLRDRCSPAGSSRPGSAKAEVARADQSSVHHDTPRNKVTQDKLVGGVSSDVPLSTEELGSGCQKLYEDLCASPENNVAHGPRPGQSVNIHLLPVEQRLLIIQRERSRKELFRRKNKAAAVIQRAWRSYQLRKHLSRLLHLKQLGARDVLRCTQLCAALLLQVWRKELELKFPKSISVSRTSKSPSKGMSAAKSARHSVLRQIYGCSQEGKVHHPIRSPKVPPVLHLSSVNSLQSIHLDSSGRSKKFSYNLQPASQSKNKPKL
ncbi:similar to Inv protein - mouse (predicted) [Rattus norvegicus]|uniref:Inversin n=1 Tax=Rattus norvegicus TaxID=10116 RepID=A6KJF5_RAT|nr:inversin [Rattus norvegicus]EDL78193.1 similar to Inv protein - mouse (predicted) [Rattus norvegicus]|eukprot:NP_001101402.1 inversin [Rattus norvegicus]